MSEKRGGMPANVGSIDRKVRIVGLVLVAVALGLFGSACKPVGRWIDGIALLTGLAGWCPAYATLGIRACKPVAPNELS
jgi:hypothetical protein